MSPLPPAVRAARIAEVQRLRSQGMTFSEIGERMGLARTTVHTCLTDPDGARLRARKDTYRGACENCGAQTDGSNGAAKAPTVCIDCVRWTPEGVLLALSEWADEHGGIPPRCIDARTAANLPSETAVANHFGSWNAGLLAAGFELKCDRRPETQQDIFDSIRAGESVKSIASRYGVCTMAIYRRMTYRGLSIHDVRAGKVAA